MRRRALVLGVVLVVVGAAAWAISSRRGNGGTATTSSGASAPLLLKSADYSSLSPNEQCKVLLAEYTKVRREWMATVGKADDSGVKLQWLDAFLTVARSADPAEVPGGFTLMAVALAQELGDNEAVMELSLLAATGARDPHDRLLAMMDYIHAAPQVIGDDKEAWSGHASTLQSFAGDVLRTLPGLIGNEAEKYLPGGESVVYLAAEALARVGRTSEAAELETTSAPLFAERAEQELASTPPSMRSAEAYRRAASRWMSAGNRGRAMELVRRIAALPNAEHDASWYMLDIARAADPKRVQLDTEMASEWLATRETWTTINDLKLAEALMLEYAFQPGEDRAAEALALGERILYNDPELLRLADEDVREHLSKSSPEWVGQTNVSANALQAMAQAARKLGDSELSDRYTAEFAAQFPGHPNNKARAASKK